MIQIEYGGMLEAFRLIDDRFEDVRMAVSAGNRGDSSKTVEISPSIFVKKVLHFPLDDIQLRR